MYDRLQDQINLWLIWVVTMAGACAIGWAAGEGIGRIAFQAYGWTVGHAVGWSIFELVVWSMRWQILRRISTVPVWRRVDSIVWFSAELMAWVIGEGFHQLSPTLWITASAVWGVIGSTSIWFILACSRQAKAGRWFVLTGTMYGLIGFVGSTFFLSFTLALVDEIQRYAATMTSPVQGWLLGGAILGVASGSLTGLAVARLWLQPLNVEDRSRL